MSMMEQLLKAGLVTEDKVKQTQQQQRKKQHQSHKNKTIKEELSSVKEQREALLVEQQAEKRRQDALHNEKVTQAQRKKAARAEARRLIDAKRQNDPTAELRFNFSPDGKKIRFVRVTAQQQKQLASGELGICRNDRDGFDYPILPRATMLRMQELEKIGEERWVYLLNDPNLSQEDAEWEALWQQV